MRSLVQVAALVLAAASAPACARPYSVNDLLAAETFGQIGFTQDGSALIFERQVGFDEGGPFEYDAYPPLRRSRIYVADPRSSAPPRQLLSVDPGEGHTAGPLSPSGRAMVVLRLKGRDWEAGVVQLSSREVRWLGLIPELAQLGRTIAWRGDEQLVIAVRNDIPLRLRAGWQARETLQAFWSATAQGKGAISQVSGASAYAGDTHPNGRLVLVDVATGGVRTLAKGDFYDVEVSPDGTALAAMENLEPLPMDMLPRQVAAPNRRRNLLLVDLTSGARSSPCADCDLAPHLMAWSPNAQEVLVYGRRFGQGWSHADLLRLSSRGARSVATGGLKLSLGYTTEGHLIPRAGWLQGEPIALLQATNEGRADWYRLTSRPTNLTAAVPGPAPKLIANDGEKAFAFASGSVWQITPKGAQRYAQSLSVLPQARFSASSRERLNAPPAVAWFRALEHGQVLARSTAGQRAPLSAMAHTQAQALAPESHAVVAMNNAHGLELVVNGVKRMELNPSFASIDFARRLEVAARGPDGERLVHHLLLPPERGQAPLPLIVVPYPGILSAGPPPPSGGVGRFPANPELMAAAGYAVLIPALPRREGSEPGENLAAEILAAVDQTAAQVSGLDVADPILWGHSFGGYAVLMAASQSGRFGAVIAAAAPTDLASARGVFDPHGEVRPGDGLSAYMVGWTESGQAGLRASPWDAPELYVRNSPVFQAGTINTPVLLIHGDTDFVRLGQAHEMFSALARQGKDVTLLTAYGEGHVVASPGNVREVYQRVFEWLRTRNLAPSDSGQALGAKSHKRPLC
jgi:dipeptidyl aminopeptidase/acylaminoacyl peptidase